MNRKRMVRKIGMNCFVSFYGMIKFLGEEKSGRYKNNVISIGLISIG
jgi:hypothetical protein